MVRKNRYLIIALIAAVLTTSIQSAQAASIQGDPEFSEQVLDCSDPGARQDVCIQSVEIFYGGQWYSAAPSGYKIPPIYAPLGTNQTYVIPDAIPTSVNRTFGIKLEHLKRIGYKSFDLSLGGWDPYQTRGVCIGGDCTWLDLNLKYRVKIRDAFLESYPENGFSIRGHNADIRIWQDSATAAPVLQLEAFPVNYWYCLYPNDSLASTCGPDSQYAKPGKLTSGMLKASYTVSDSSIIPTRVIAPYPGVQVPFSASNFSGSVGYSGIKRQWIISGSAPHDDFNGNLITGALRVRFDSITWANLVAQVPSLAFAQSTGGAVIQAEGTKGELAQGSFALNEIGTMDLNVSNIHFSSPTFIVTSNGAILKSGKKYSAKTLAKRIGFKSIKSATIKRVDKSEGCKLKSGKLSLKKQQYCTLKLVVKGKKGKAKTSYVTFLGN